MRFMHDGLYAFQAQEKPFAPLAALGERVDERDGARSLGGRRGVD